MINRNQPHRPKMTLVMPKPALKSQMTPYQALYKAMSILLTTESVDQVQELANHLANPNQNTGSRV